MIKIKKGLDLPIAGRPADEVTDGSVVSRVALLGRDHVGLKPRMLVAEGDRVMLGQALFHDKRDPHVHFVSPGQGVVAAVNRGNRRRLLSVVIETDEQNPQEVELEDFDRSDRDAESITHALCRSGLWTSFRTRPFGKIPQSDTRPRSIFVTAIDTEPLSAKPSTVVAGNEAYFAEGIRVIERLTDGAVFICSAADWAIETETSDKIRDARFSGPHPAGLPGTHIHHLDPAAADRIVWHIGYQDVVAIGRLFSAGKVGFERVIALGGPGFDRPRHVRTRIGASIEELTAGELQFEGVVSGAPRLISGSVLSGREARGPEAFLGRYHNQVSALAEFRRRRWFGWFRRGNGAHSFAGLFSGTVPQSQKAMTTAMSETRRSVIPVEAFEKVLPFDIHPVPLLQSMVIRDTDKAQALGCLELDADDLALCSYVCPSNLDYGSILRANLEQIEREG